MRGTVYATTISTPVGSAAATAELQQHRESCLSTLSVVAFICEQSACQLMLFVRNLEEARATATALAAASRRAARAGSGTARGQLAGAPRGARGYVHARRR